MVRKLFLLTVLILIPFTLIFSQTEGGKFAYVGVDACAPCHKSEKQGKQSVIWKETKHSQAYKALQTEKADNIAKELGHETPAVETEACLKCHATGYNVDVSLLGAKFKIEDGVQCETCHGPGSEYKSLKVMKNREDAIAKGLIVHENHEDFCTGCHNPESPTFVEIDVKAAWEKIKHPVPGK